MAGSFGYELDLNTLSETEKQEVAQQVAQYKEYQELIYNGSYFRLSDPYRDGMAVWAFESEDQAQMLVQGVVYRAASNTLRKRLRLRGLQPGACYKVQGEQKVYTGSALMAGGILLPRMSGDDAAFDLYIEKVDEHTRSE